MHISRLREKQQGSRFGPRIAALKRKAVDADYRERYGIFLLLLFLPSISYNRQRKKCVCYLVRACRTADLNIRKFISRFGLESFYKDYLPLHEEMGLEHLPGLRWELVEKKKAETLKIKKSKKPGSKGGRGESKEGKGQL